MLVLRQLCKNLFTNFLDITPKHPGALVVVSQGGWGL